VVLSQLVPKIPCFFSWPVFTFELLFWFGCPLLLLPLPFSAFLLPFRSASSYTPFVFFGLPY
jgi:hypothetical protein